MYFAVKLLSSDEIILIRSLGFFVEASFGPDIDLSFSFPLSLLVSESVALLFEWQTFSSFQWDYLHLGGLDGPIRRNPGRDIPVRSFIACWSSSVGVSCLTHCHHHSIVETSRRQRDVLNLPPLL